MAEPKNEEGFKVVDRRLFTEQGELRKDAVEQERRDEEEASRKAAEQAKVAQKHAANPAAASDDGSAGEPEEEDAIPASRSFQVLVDFLTRNAAAMLGGMADPRTGQPFVDIEGAR